MEVEVYADLLFLVNAGMDGLCFGLTGRLLHRPLSRLRIGVGAALGGLYAVASLFWEVPSPAALGLDVLVCLLMCGVVFTGRRAGKGNFLPSAATYFALSMALGGVMTALYHLLNRLGIPDRLPADEDGLGVWLFALLALAGSLLTLWGGRAFRREAATRRCRVTVILDGKRVELEGLLDTGNLLRDPMSGRPVICADRVALAPILPPRLAEALAAGGVDAWSQAGATHRLRVIPVATATGHSLLVGFLPDGVELGYLPGGRSAKEVTCRVDAVIAAARLEEAEALVPSVLL